MNREVKVFKRYCVILTLLLSGCGAWQAASDATSNTYDTVFHNRGKTVNVDLSASAALNQDSAGRSRSVAVRVYQLKDRKRFDEASYVDLMSKDASILAPDLQASMAAVVNPGGAVSLSQPMQHDTKFVAIAAFYASTDQAGNWKQVVTLKKLPPDAPLKLTLVDKQLEVSAADAKASKR